MITGECILCIYGENLDFESISKYMGINPSKTTYKGQHIISDKYAPKDFWSYKRSIGTQDDFLDTIKSLVGQLVDKKEYIKKLNQKNQIIINCYIRSDFGQIGFSLDKDAIHILNELGIEIEFHILSFGKVF